MSGMEDSTVGPWVLCCWGVFTSFIMLWPLTSGSKGPLSSFPHDNLNIFHLQKNSLAILHFLECYSDIEWHVFCHVPSNNFHHDLLQTVVGNCLSPLTLGSTLLGCCQAFCNRGRGNSNNDNLQSCVTSQPFLLNLLHFTSFVIQINSWIFHSSDLMAGGRQEERGSGGRYVRLIINIAGVQQWATIGIIVCVVLVCLVSSLINHSAHINNPNCV